MVAFIISKDCILQVFVLDFPPRLTPNLEEQTYLRQGYHRMAARRGKCKIVLVDSSILYFIYRV